MISIRHKHGTLYDGTAALNTKDVNAMLACLGQDCAFENISAGKVTVRTNGKAELEALAE